MSGAMAWAAAVVIASAAWGADGRDCAGVAEAPAGKPFHAGSRSQVFVDRALVRSAENIIYTLHPAAKRPGAVWLSHVQDEQNPGPCGVKVLFDEEEKVFKSWGKGPYNTSVDGLRWSPKEARNETWNHLLRISVIKDALDPDPARRYKIVAFGPSKPFPAGMKDADVVGENPDGSKRIFWHEKGYNTLISADGKTLVHFSREPICVGPNHPKPPGDMVTAYYDKRLGLYVAFVKMGPKDRSKATKFTAGRRAFSMVTSKDFVNWSEPRLVFAVDQEDDDGAAARIEEVRPLLLKPTDPKLLATHIYGVGGPIELECGVIVLLRLFTNHNTGADGPSEVQMAFSRDLEKWERPFRQPFIPRGKVAPKGETSEWDSCWFNNEGPGVAVGDEVWVYYEARNTPHDHPVGFSASSFPAAERAAAQKLVGTKYLSGIGIATWKRDRFVSVDAPAAGGTLTTVPMTFEGGRLEINALTLPGGEIVVTLLDPSGKPVARSRPFAGDALRHETQWTSPLDLAVLAGKPVSLRFSIKNAKLFAFAFRP
ncbi:MAG TPA: hypothetical protein P5137_03900 [Candidatus Brocadiia bacterium]|nr:hypothetical protein [Candidatus Brocadiia bacterium]